MFFDKAGLKSLLEQHKTRKSQWELSITYLTLRPWCRPRQGVGLGDLDLDLVDDDYECSKLFRVSAVSNVSRKMVSF